MQRLTTCFLAAALALSLCSAASAGKIYKWTDAQGKVHYSDSPPPAEQSPEQVKVDRAPTPPPVAPQTQPAPAADSMQAREQAQAEEARKQREAQELRNKEVIAKVEEDRRKKVVEECKRRREVYCDSYESVMKGQEADRARWERAEQINKTHRDAQCRANGQFCGK